MSKKLLIRNKYWYGGIHSEVVESIMLKCHNILKIEKNTKLEIYLDINATNPRYTDADDTASFKKYMRDKYPKLQFGEPKKFDYFIDCTCENHNNLDTDKNSTNKYICHEVKENLKGNPNVYFLTPLAKIRGIGKFIWADILPYANCMKKSNIPIYIIQGNLNQNRRYLDLLIKILDQSYKYKFIFKIVGRGHLPKQLEKYKDKLLLKNNLSFIDYHKEFLDAYCILPLISKKTHGHYYYNRLTSSINYSRGYKLKCLIDNDLQKIYNLPNVQIYNDINDIDIAFSKTLLEFYEKK